MKIIRNFFVALCLFSIPLVAAEPTKETLTSAWESVQKSNPHNIEFKKLSPGQYKLKNDELSLDGEIKIKDIFIDESNGLTNEMEQIISGSIQIDFTSSLKNSTENNWNAVNFWSKNNQFYFDKKSQSWITSKEYSLRESKRMNKAQIIDTYSTYGYMLVILLFLIYAGMAVVKGKKASDRTLQTSEKAATLQEENNKLLREILAELKKA